MSGLEKSETMALRSEAEIQLHLLDLVERGGSISQRTAAQQLGIALGLVNAYLKRAITKGLVKISQVPPNRYAYYLTPEGFNEKRRLTAEYMRQSFNFFRLARQHCDALLAQAVANDWRRLACVGIGEIGEVARLSALAFDVEIVGFVDPTAKETRFAGAPVVACLGELGTVDAVVLADFLHAQETYDSLRLQLPESRILIPNLLKVTRGSRPNGEA